MIDKNRKTLIEQKITVYTPISNCGCGSFTREKKKAYNSYGGSLDIGYSREQLSARYNAYKTNYRIDVSGNKIVCSCGYTLFSKNQCMQCGKSLTKDK